MAKYIYLIILLVVMIVLAPILINFIVSSASPFGISIAKKNDWIAFYGSYMGGIITLVGVSLTILYTLYQYKDQDRKRVKPYISITQLLKTEYRNDISKLGLTDNDYEMGLATFLGETISLPNDLLVEELSLYGIIKNIGIGTAVKIKIINIKLEKRILEYGYTNTYHALEVGGKVYFLIEFFKTVISYNDLGEEYKTSILKDQGNEEVSELPNIYLYFDVTYEDLMGNRYVQHAKSKVQVIDYEKGKSFNLLFDTISTPELIKK